jgi:predicted alpha-1,6-mannanase (GH76 family)
LRTCLYLAFAAASLLGPRPCQATWETTGDWKASGDDAIAVRTDGLATAWNAALRPGRSWSVYTHVAMRRGKQLIGSARLLFGDADRNARLAVNVQQRAGDLTTVEVQVFRRDGRTVLTSGWIPGGDADFALRVCRAGGSLKVALYGDKYVAYVARTPEIPPAVLDAIARFGVGAEAAEVRFSDLTFESPWAEPEHYTAQAEAAVDDLLTHFWTGGLTAGCIVPTSHGYPLPCSTPPGSARARGGLWERAMMAFAMDSLYRANGDPTISQRLRTEWTRLKTLFTPEELEAAGGPLHPACDDSGWDALYYLTLYRHSHDRAALDRAKGLLDNAFRRWLDGELGGGLWYNNQRQAKSLYAVAVVIAAFEAAEATGDTAMKDKALGCYQWMESNLLRPDGLYWADRGRAGPLGHDDPERIAEAGSVSFLAGNMAMGVLHARLYRATGDSLYLERALRTADGIAGKLTAGGIYLDDRDAWSNGTFAGDWAEDVLSLPGLDAAHRQLLQRTADSVYRNARTSRGYYGGSWGGPAEGPGSRWCVKGSRPEQITTSSSSVMMIVAAALAAKERPADRHN